MTLRSGIGPLSSRRQRSAIHTICGSSIVSSLLQPVSALDELYESFHEPRRRSAIDNIVVKGHRQIEHVPRFDTPVDDCWLTTDPTHDQEDRLPGRRQAPAATATGHAQRSDTDRAGRCARRSSQCSQPRPWRR
jgi:hypothetical protein